MSILQVLPPRSGLVEAVLSHLEGDGPDFSAHVVVFPGKRPAHFLRKALAARAGGTVIPPRIFSVDTFVGFLYGERLGKRDREIGAYDALGMLYAIHRSTGVPVGGESFRSFESFAGVGLALFEELEEAALGGASHERLQSAVASGGGARHAALPEYFRRFYAMLGESGRSTRATRYWSVVRAWEETRLHEEKKVVLAGFFSLNAAERALFKRVRAAENGVLLFQEGRGLDRALGEIGEAAAAAERAGTPSITLTSSPDEHGQVFALAARLRERLRAGWKPDERTVIVLPSAALLMPLRHHCLPLLAEEEYNVSLGYPLAAGPLAGLLGSLVELAASRIDGRLQASDYLAVMVHPYVKGVRMGDSADATRVIVHLLEDHLADHPSRTTVTLEQLESAGDVFDRAAAYISTPDTVVPASAAAAHLRELHDRVVRPFLGFTTLGGMAGAVIDLIQFIDDRSTAGGHAYFRPFAVALRDAVEELRASRLAATPVSASDTLPAMLRTLLGGLTVPFPGTPLKGLQVLGFLETRNLRFDTVYLMDANDDVLPGTRRPDLLLTPAVRRALGLPDQREREDITAYHLDVLLQGAGEVHVFSVENDRKERSRYVERLLWERRRTGGPDTPAETVSPVEYRVDLTASRPAPVEKSARAVDALRRKVLNPTALDTYLACELRFYYAHLLGLEERGEIGDEVERKDIGIVVHRILQKLIAPAIGRELRAEDLKPERLDRIVDTVFSETFGDDPFGPRVLLRTQIAKHLREFVEGYQVPLLGPGTPRILGLEQKVEGTVAGVPMRGKLDRVEERAGAVWILDYKTGASDAPYRVRFSRLDLADRAGWGNAVGSLQLPLYAMLFAGAAGRPLDSIRPAYLFLGRHTIDGRIESPLFGEQDDPAALYPLLGDVVAAVAAELRDPARPFMPPQDLRTVCPGCPFTAICGTAWVKGPRDRE